MDNPLLINPGEHALIAGMTGSGKSILAQEVCRNFEYAPVIILDAKIDPSWKDVPMGEQNMEIIHSHAEFNKLLSKPKKYHPDYVLIRPSLQESTDSDALDEYLLDVYNKGRKMAVVIDEGYTLHKGGRCGMGLTACLTRGRSKGISTIVCTQRPCWLSRFCLTEAKHLFVFRLVDAQDRKRITEIAPYNPNQTLDKYHFFRYRQGDDSGIVYKPIPLRYIQTGGQTPEPESRHRWI